MSVSAAKKPEIDRSRDASDQTVNRIESVTTRSHARDILLVEDSRSLARVYFEYLRREPVTTQHVTTGREAIEILRADPPRVLILDIQLPDMNGFDILEIIQAESIPTNVVVITAHGSVDMALRAVNKGARDFLEKPFTADRLLTTVRNELEHRRLNEIADVIGATTRTGYCGFIGSSLVMQTLYRVIDSASASEAPIFIFGESGTGKKVCAKAIHQNSRRRDGPFITVNCAAITSASLEKELFGDSGQSESESGSAAGLPNGAVSFADGGTLFLDEVTEMDLSLQAKLLRFVETGKYQLTGCTQSRPADVRIVCSSTKQPTAALAENRIREDLFYRLHVIPITLAPLREREADVVDIACHFLQDFSNHEGKQFKSIDPDAQQALLSYHWPGNIRELQNVIRSVTVLYDSSVVRREFLPSQITSAAGPYAHNGLQSGTQSIAARPMTTTSFSNNGSPNNNDSRASVRPLWLVEREAIESAIEQLGGNIPCAAAALEVSPSTLYRKRQAWRDDESTAGSLDDKQKS